MTIKFNGEEEPCKKPYAKPALTRVELVPKEAVMGSCRVTTASPNAGTYSDCQFGQTHSCLAWGGTAQQQSTPQRK